LIDRRLHNDHEDLMGDQLLLELDHIDFGDHNTGIKLLFIPVFSPRFLCRLTAFMELL
jgi:hypothetical protein